MWLLRCRLLPLLELLTRLGETVEASRSPRYADRGRAATATPARIPDDLGRYADAALRAALADRGARRRALGTWLSEPKPGTWFERGDDSLPDADLVLDRRTRFLYDNDAFYVNGEAHRVANGPAAAALRELADRRHLSAVALRRAGPSVHALLAGWCEAGWCHALRSPDDHDDRSPP